MSTQNHRDTSLSSEQVVNNQVPTEDVKIVPLAAEDSPASAPKQLHFISTGVWRSSHPFPEHHSYLSETLKVKTILTLVEPEMVDRGLEFSQHCKAVGITQHVIPMFPTNHEGAFSPEHMREAMTIMHDQSKHPVLVHCYNGIHRTGVVVGLFQKLMGELSITDIHAGYDRVAEHLSRENDKAYLASVDITIFEGCRVMKALAEGEVESRKVGAE